MAVIVSSLLFFTFTLCFVFNLLLICDTGKMLRILVIPKISTNLKKKDSIAGEQRLYSVAASSMAMQDGSFMESDDAPEKPLKL